LTDFFAMHTTVPSPLAHHVIVTQD
jgi:hypothetical protein